MQDAVAKAMALESLAGCLDIGLAAALTHYAAHPEELPQEVRDAVLRNENRRGLTAAEIEERAGQTLKY